MQPSAHLLLLPLILLSQAAPSRSAPKLREPALRRLRVGATKPAGWLHRQLTLQARGLTSLLPDWWSYLNISKWMGAAGSEPEQFVPYYLNGLIPLSYQLPNEAPLVALRKRYVEHILAKQAAPASHGWLGPPVCAHHISGCAHNYWSKYPAVLAFESLAEAAPEAEAARVREALLAHHTAFYAALSAGAPALNESRWGFARHEDGIDGIEWMLEHASQGNESLLRSLASLLHEQSDAIMRGVARELGGGFGWVDWFRSGDPFSAHDDSADATGTAHTLRHGVDIGEAMKLGALLWRLDGDEESKASPAVALAWADSYLHMADGMFFADEEVSGNHTASRGTETCSVVETMNSMRIGYEMTGNITFIDRLERLAFNSLPASTWDDFTANVYHHCSNQLEAAEGPYEYSVFFCCSANVHQGARRRSNPRTAPQPCTPVRDPLPSGSPPAGCASPLRTDKTVAADQCHIARLLLMSTQAGPSSCSRRCTSPRVAALLSSPATLHPSPRFRTVALSLSLAATRLWTT
jgi:hypothetical protein